MIDTNRIRKLLDTPVGVGDGLIRDLCDEIDRLRAKSKPQGKTVRVKVAVAVDSFKHWSASGWDGASAADMKDGLFDSMEGVASFYWLTADLPIPEETTVKAEVNTATTDENSTGGRG